MTTVHDDIERVRRQARQIASADEISVTIAQMAARIGERLAELNPVVLAVMHGGAFTAINLCRHFDFPYEFDYVHLTRYGDQLHGGELNWHVCPAQDLVGRVVLLVDDVLDRGITLEALRQSLHELPVAELYTAALVRKQLDTASARPALDFVGIETEDVYIFGCGMDYKGYWRGLPALYARTET